MVLQGCYLSYIFSRDSGPGWKKEQDIKEKHDRQREKEREKQRVSEKKREWGEQGFEWWLAWDVNVLWVFSSLLAATVRRPAGQHAALSWSQDGTTAPAT